MKRSMITVLNVVAVMLAACPALANPVVVVPGVDGTVPTPGNQRDVGPRVASWGEVWGLVGGRNPASERVPQKQNGPRPSDMAENTRPSQEQ